MARDKVIGLYSLCVKFEDDNKAYMIGFNKKDDDKLFYKLNLELIDEFTSKYPTKQSLLERLQRSTKGDKKVVDAFILYNRAQVNKLDDNSIETTPTVRKLDVIINDEIIGKICKNFVDGKYVENKLKKLDGEDDNIKYIFNNIIRIVETEDGFNMIKSDSYLSQYADHFKEKLLEHGIYALNARGKEMSNTYPVAKDALLSSYATFRHVYTHLIKNDIKDASIYSTKPSIIKQNKKVVDNKDVEEQPIENLINIDDMASKIENPILRNLYIAYNGNSDTLFEYILTAYVGDEAGIFLNSLSYNDQLIAFGDYDLFLEKCQNLWPDMFGTRRL